MLHLHADGVPQAGNIDLTLDLVEPHKALGPQQAVQLGKEDPPWRGPGSIFRSRVHSQEPAAHPPMEIGWGQDARFRVPTFTSLEA